MPANNITPRFQFVFLFLFWALVAIVTTLLLKELNGNIVGFPHMDKFIHALLFALLTATGYFAYSKYRTYLYIGLAVYGIITELLQAAITITRFASVYDWFADITGILLCMLIIKATHAYSIKKTPYGS